MRFRSRRTFSRRPELPTLSAALDTLTHALSGALLARATARHPDAAAAGASPPVWQRVTLGAVAAAFPDLDFVAGYLSPLAYLYHHRGVTHSLVMLPLWALLLAWIGARVFRTPGGWRVWWGAAALSLAAHIAGDLITSFGTMIFAPFSDARFALDTTFIIDLWFSGIILAGLAASLVWRASRVPAVAGCAVLAGYVGLQGLAQYKAIEFGRDYARSIRWDGATVSALPRPVSPFNWTVVVQRDGEYRYSNVNLRAREVPEEADETDSLITRLASHYHPRAVAAWHRASLHGRGEEEIARAKEAWNRPEFEFFRWFAAYPVLIGSDERCTWFRDLRFAQPGMARSPFRYGVCREADGRWQAYERRSDESVAAVY